MILVCRFCRINYDVATWTPPANCIMLGTFRLGSDNDVNGLRVIFTNSDLVFYYFPTKISPGVKIARRRADTRPTHSSFSKSKHMKF